VVVTYLFYLSLCFFWLLRLLLPFAIRDVVLSSVACLIAPSGRGWHSWAHLACVERLVLRTNPTYWLLSGKRRMCFEQVGERCRVATGQMCQIPLVSVRGSTASTVDPREVLGVRESANSRIKSIKLPSASGGRYRVPSGIVEGWCVAARISRSGGDCVKC